MVLLDPVRRKVFDDTGYDVELADPVDLQALIVIRKLVNELTLDEREPGSFDPLARMRDDLSEDMRKARFSKRELDAARGEHHLERLEKRPSTDILGSMLPPGQGHRLGDQRNRSQDQGQRARLREWLRPLKSLCHENEDGLLMTEGGRSNNFRAGGTDRPLWVVPA